MKVLHVPFGYFPDPVGGTEVYVGELVSALRRHGVDSVIAAPALGTESRVYEHAGASVYRFAVARSTNLAQLYGEGDPASASAIARVLEETGADVLHLHSFTNAASLRAVRAARGRGVAVAFTYHTPTASCVRGTLLRDGREPCDGALLAQRCASCLLESRGVPAAVRGLLSRMPTIVSSAVAASEVSGRWVTALRARELTHTRHEAFRELLGEADAVIAVCEWVRSLLVRAGAIPSRVMLSRHGIDAQPIARPPTRNASGALRFAFLGRLHPTKGVHVAVRALASRPELPVTLDIFGVAQDDEGSRYATELRALAGSDSRVRFRPPVPSADVVRMLADYDATVVPSQWLETGPLTVLESFAAGVPVVGSNLGGIAELVAHDRDGWLVPHASVGAWAAAFERFANDRALVTRLAGGVRPPRSTDDVARDMASLYQAILPRGGTQPRRLGTVRPGDVIPAGAV